MTPFQDTLKRHRLSLTRQKTEILQINVGKLCDLACLHCHVEAGPKRKEIMERKTVERLMELLKKSPAVQTVDLTGGAPELNPNFRYLVEESSKILTSRKAALRGSLHPALPVEGATQAPVIDRCNLTVLFQKGQEETPYFLKEHRVQIVASLPCYSKENVEAQRGRGVFDKSIRALRFLNELGYGKEGTGLLLDLVYNPVGPFLPPPQSELEADYKKELKELFGIEFNHLLTITNMPIKRFHDYLERRGELDQYADLLATHFNQEAVGRVMCRNLVSIGWDGKIYDCDFNQMLEIPLGGKRRTIWEIESLDELVSESIAFANHCYGCTAGAGSSCSGSLVKKGGYRNDK
ncbi:MAG: arsenosugar biosynthesis radical SAM protein ArsS [Deltaproteobacteria bacterium]|nr:arsenosugar biosynthesis radical SAM protein ArsS [Deltaproteobacteria bacterium]